MNTSMIETIDVDTGMGTIVHDEGTLQVDMNAYTVLDANGDVVGDIDDHVSDDNGVPVSVTWSVRVVTSPNSGDSETGETGPLGPSDPVPDIYQQLFGINPEDLTLGGRAVLGALMAYAPFLGIIGLDGATLNNLFSELDTVRNAALTKVGNSISNIDALVEKVTPGLKDTSESVADLLGGVLSGLLGRLDTSNPTADFPDVIDGSTGLVRILGEIGKFLSNFDMFAEKMTGETRDGKMVKAFVANLDGLMENALTYIEGALMSKADADAAAAAEEAAATE